MSVLLVAPVLPIVDNSCDAVDTEIGRIHVVIVLDSDSNIFLKVPILSPNGQTTYKWFVLNKAELNYPVGTIEQVTCSISWTEQTGAMFQICASTRDDIHVYDPSYSSNGVVTYTWSEETAPESPYLPNPYGQSKRNN